MIQYFLFCFISLLAGVGLLSLFRIPLSFRLKIFLAPLITLSFWVVSLGIAVVYDLPVKYEAVPLWVITFILAGIGLYAWKSQAGNIKRIDYWGIAFVLLLPLLTLFPYVWNGLHDFPAGSSADGWSYVAVGQYLLDYARGTEGGLAPLYQYASHLSHSRFIASALLAFFSMFSIKIGASYYVLNVFLVWTLFIIGSTCFYLARVFQWNYLAFVYVFLVVFSQWLFNIIWANNFDNLLALAFLPAFVSMMRNIKFPDRRWGFILSGLAAAAFYSYPEFFPFILIGAIFAYGQKMWEQRAFVGQFILLLSITVILAGLLIAPYFKEAISYFAQQFNLTATAHVRPGEGYFHGLLLVRQLLPSYFGFSMCGWIDYFLAGAMLMMMMVGCCLCLRARYFDVIAIFFMLLVGSLIMIFRSHYSYGAYKFIVLNWFIMIFFMVMTISWMLNHLPHKKIVMIGFSLMGCLLLGVNIHVFHHFSKSVRIRSLKSLETLAHVSMLPRSSPLVVAINDDVINQWAVYFLRNSPIRLVFYRSYMAQPHVIPFMDRSVHFQLTESRYLLTDSDYTLPKNQLIWSNDFCRLWIFSEPYIYLMSIENPNGLERWNNQPGFWVGQRVTEIDVMSSRYGTAQLQFTASLGPSLPASIARHLKIYNQNGYEKQIRLSKIMQISLDIPVKKGKNTIFLAVKEKPLIQRLPNGDERSLLVGCTDLSVRLKK